LRKYSRKENVNLSVYNTLLKFGEYNV